MILRIICWIITLPYNIIGISYNMMQKTLHIRKRYLFIAILSIFSFNCIVSSCSSDDAEQIAETKTRLTKIRGAVSEYESHLRDGSMIMNISDLRQDIQADSAWDGRRHESPLKDREDLLKDAWGNELFLKLERNSRFVCSSGRDGVAYNDCKYSVELPNPVKHSMRTAAR